MLDVAAHSRYNRTSQVIPPIQTLFRLAFMISIGSLKVTVSSLQIAFAALLLAALVLIGLEMAVRKPSLDARFPSGYGSPMVVLDRKFFELKQLTASEGPFDCVIIGDSTLRRAIDPAMLAESYQAQTGELLRCYNFGVGGLRFIEAATVAEVISAKYQPDVILITTHILDLQEAKADRLVDNPWISYQLSEPVLTGWFLDHSSLYRRYTEASLNTRARQKDREELFPEWTLADAGFAPRFDDMNISKLDCPEVITAQTFELGGTSQEGLDRLSNLFAQGQPIILVELPVSPPVTSPDCRADYPDFLSDLRLFSRASGIPLVEAGGTASQVSDDGWADSVHVNDRGAPIISEWLGKALSSMIETITRVTPGQS
jgi:hypothetical protein